MAFTTDLFGIEINLGLLLIGITLILIFCFFLLLFEIYKLKTLITEEKVDIKRFETDLQGIEKKGSGDKSVSKSLESAKSFVKGSLSSGMNKDQIRGVLHRRGWNNKDIDEVFKGVN